MRTTLLPGLLGVAAPQRRARHQRRRAVRDRLRRAAARGPEPARHHRPAAPVGRRAVRPPTTSRRSRRLLPDQPLHVAVALTGQRSPAGWWGAGAGSTWADAVEAARVVARRRGCRARRPRGRGAGAVAPGPVRRARARRPRSSATPASSPPVRARALGLPTRTARHGARPRRPDRRGGRLPSSPGRSPPIRWRRRTSPSSSTPRCRRPPSRPRSSTARARCSSPCACSTSTPVEQVDAGRKSLAFALRFRAPDRTLTVEEVSAARDSAVAAAAATVGAVRRA